MFLLQRLRFAIVLVFQLTASYAYAEASCFWHIQSWPQTQEGQSLSAVAATAANDVWVVGASGVKPLIRNWNGTSWRLVDAPRPYNQEKLTGIIAGSSADAWAVGGATNDEQQMFAIADHYDGSKWTNDPLPPKPGYTTVLSGIAYAGTGIWAVGGVYPAGNSRTEVTYALFHGKQWQYVATPNVGNGANWLTAISASSAVNVWAVGRSASRDGFQSALIEHWNGKWQVVPQPIAGGILTSVYAISNTNVWAAGTYSLKGSRFFLPLFEHWNGQAWSMVASPTITGGQIFGLSGSASNDIVAVGTVGGAGPIVPLAEHWDGTAWSIVQTPQVSGDMFVGVAHVPGTTDYWAAGNLNPSEEDALKAVTARYECAAGIVRSRPHR